MRTKTESDILGLISKHFPLTTDIKLEHPADPQYGDFSTNIAMVMAKDSKMNPRSVAQDIKTKLLSDIKKNEGVFIEKIEITGPGFINFYLHKDYLLKQAIDYNFDLEFHEKMAAYGQGKTMVIDYSAPNIAKPFGIGHLRSTNIGQAVYNLYKLLGWKTIGDNHLGDWGTQFGKLIVAIKKWGGKPVLEMTISDLERLYVQFHTEAEHDESLNEEGRAWFARLEKGDKEARALWHDCVTISLQEFDRVYQLLGVKIDYTHGESFYETMLQDVIDELKAKKNCS